MTRIGSPLSNPAPLRPRDTNPTKLPSFLCLKQPQKTPAHIRTATMSRHKLVKNMDLDKELDDYDGEYEEEPFGMY